MALAEDRAGRIAALGYDPAPLARDRVGRCNLCGSPHHVEVSRRDRYGYAGRLLVCARCGLGFLSPRLTAEAYADFYGETYRPLVSAHHGRRIDAETVQDDQRGYADELASFLDASLPAPPATVLDVGGSTGVVAGALAAAFGSRATVLDPAPDELEVAAAAGMETVAGFAEDFDPGERRWDLVLLCQTIDHLLDVRATLASLRRLVADDGHVFVDVLDLAWSLRRHGAVEAVVKVDHPYYLTRDTARAFLTLTGLEVVAERMSDDGHWGFLARPAVPTEPHWTALRDRADALLDEVWDRRAHPAAGP
jgi:2-polyprenyl-3-methyl-5-hydroxy-6-metoxy-1,4-benzoquinol methylase